MSLNVQRQVKVRDLKRSQIYLWLKVVNFASFNFAPFLCLRLI